MNKSKMSTPSSSSKMANKQKTPTTPTTPNRPAQLTGSPRVLNDTVITIHGLIQAWKRCLLGGVRSFGTLQKLWTLDSIKTESDRQITCEQIGDMVRLMEGLVGSMHAHAEKLISLAALNKDSPPPFFTWKYSDFMKMAIRTARNFQAETAIRVSLAAKLSTAKYEELDFCTIAWLHFVYAGGSFDTEFGAMLRELGPAAIQTQS